MIAAIAIIIAGCKKDIDHNNVFTNDKQHSGDTITTPPVDTTTPPVDTIPVSGCDTSNVTYGGTIRGIVIANCNSCHNGTSTGGDDDDDDDDAPNLTTYANLVAAINDVGANKFMGMINHTRSDYMPPSYKLTDCEIRQFAVWIRNGMPQ